MELPAKLAFLRNQRELTQLDLAEKLNVSRQAVSRWESGAAAPSVESLKALSKLYGISLDYLLNDDAEEVPRAEKLPVDMGGIVQGKKHAVLRFWAALAAVLIAVALCLTALQRQEQNRPIPIEEMDSMAEDDYPTVTFSLEWQ